jgi:hypothetical protein
LPVLRLFFVILIAAGFAVSFAELVRQSDAQRGDEAISMRCGEAGNPPCGWHGLARLD